MARNTKFNCIEEYAKSKGMKFYEFPNDKDPKSYVVIWTTDIKNFWSFFEDMVWVNKINNKTAESGVWECEGTKGFSVISETNNKIWKTSDPAWKPYEKPTADPENIFACIENHFKERGLEIITLGESKGVRISPTSLWLFYPPNSDNRQRWFDMENSVVKEKGDWTCDGESNFTIKKESGETYSSQTGDSDSDTSDTSDSEEASDFPLKFGSEGPKVVQLQHFLNEKGTGTKLVTDGIFGNKTKDKLVRYQKDNNLI
jgi:hypothetical protein